MKKIVTSKLAWPSWVVLFLALLLSLGQLQKIPLVMGSIFFHDLLIGSVLIFTLFTSKTFRFFLFQKLINLKPVSKLLIVFIGLQIIFSILLHFTHFTPIFYLGRLILYGAFGWWLEFQVQQKQLSSIFLIKCFILAGCLIAYFGWLQYLFLPDTRFLFWLGWDDHYYRLISTLLDPGFTGIILVLSMLLLQSWFGGLKPAQRKQKQYLWSFITLMTLLSSSTFLTFSRATFLAFGVMELSFIAFFTRQKKKLLGVILMIALIPLIAFWILPNPSGEGHNLLRTSTIQARLTAAETTLESIKPTQLVWGAGFFNSAIASQNVYQQPNHAQIPDNWILFVLQGGGVFGLGLVLSWLIVVLRTTWRQNPLLVIGVVTILIHGFFNASLVYPFVVLWGVSFRFLSANPDR